MNLYHPAKLAVALFALEIWGGGLLAQTIDSKSYDSVLLPTGQRQLFLDDYLVGHLYNVARVIHPVQKYEGNPVIRADSPTDGPAIQIRSGPAWDEQERVWKIWYIASGGGHGCGFARSKDGIHWEKPALGLVERNGRKDNNLVMVKDDPKAFVQHVLLDPAAPPERRYKAVIGGNFRQPLVSADGYLFTPLDVPPIPSQDESHLTWDNLQKQYILTVKLRGPFGRAVFLSLSKDFEHWSNPELIYHADAQDQILGAQHIREVEANPRMQRPTVNHAEEYRTEIYNMPVFDYEGIYIGLPTYFEASAYIPSIKNQDGVSGTKLATSRDLRTWTRVGDRKHFIPLSEMGPGVLDTGQILAASHPIRMGDELWFYYTGLKTRYNPDDQPDAGGIHLAKLRRDGFVSFNAGDEEGFLETRAVRFDGNHLYVNADVRRGELRAEVMDAKGQNVLAGWSLDHCNPIAGDQLRAELRWAGHDLKELHGQHVRLRFHFKNADLYAFWPES
ncbi:MAG: hypothetical protein EXS39_03710 [Opitutaceae bacterium]|nr:hypothetical protein [Opitutaceae bacterium]